MRLLSALLFSLFLALPVRAMDVQAAIDALPPGGGIVNIPCGYHGNTPLTLKSGVTLQGTNRHCTVIPAIQAVPDRVYNVIIRDLSIHGGLVPSGQPPKAYAMDVRKFTTSHFENLHVYGSDYGVVMVGPAYYNMFENVTVTANITAVELSGGANQNTFIGGKWSAPTGLAIYSVNGTTIIGTALEDAINNMVFKVIVGDDGSTKAMGVRQEDANHSSTYWNQ